MEFKLYYRLGISRIHAIEDFLRVQYKEDAKDLGLFFTFEDYNLDVGENYFINFIKDFGFQSVEFEIGRLLRKDDELFVKIKQNKSLKNLKEDLDKKLQKLEDLYGLDDTEKEKKFIPRIYLTSDQREFDLNNKYLTGLTDVIRKIYIAKKEDNQWKYIWTIHNFDKDR